MVDIKKPLLIRILLHPSFPLMNSVKLKRTEPENKQKTHFNWGVESLPWLILMDKKRVVQAEGLGIEKIAEEIKNNKQ